MNHRRFDDIRKIERLVITHPSQDHLSPEKCHDFSWIRGKFGTGETHIISTGAGKTEIFSTIAFEGISDQIMLEILDVPHHGSAVQSASFDPPRAAEFLALILPIKYREDLIGCAEEEYWTRVLPRFGVRKARLVFWIQVIHGWLIFLARPLAGIAGLAWFGRIVNWSIGKLLK